MPEIQAFRTLRMEDQEFEDSMGDIGRACFKNKNK
jgi:hypothetical protein